MAPSFEELESSVVRLAGVLRGPGRALHGPEVGTTRRHIGLRDYLKPVPLVEGYIACLLGLKIAGKRAGIRPAENRLKQLPANALALPLWLNAHASQIPVSSRHVSMMEYAKVLHHGAEAAHRILTERLNDMVKPGRLHALGGKIQIAL